MEFHQEPKKLNAFVMKGNRYSNYTYFNGISRSVISLTKKFVIEAVVGKLNITVDGNGTPNCCCRFVRNSTLAKLSMPESMKGVSWSTESALPVISKTMAMIRCATIPGSGPTYAATAVAFGASVTAGVGPVGALGIASTGLATTTTGSDASVSLSNAAIILSRSASPIVVASSCASSSTPAALANLPFAIQAFASMHMPFA
mmetsp:Transcript_24631/g.39545  ORF Transcript_24631/g.39545 Transcript_24631/m.39545 type:complete len:202 (-) Transcript_24631:1833-2438(-)